MMNLKAGAAYLKSVFITLFICMLIMLLLTFWSAVANVQAFKSSARTVLDSYVTEQSMRIYDEMKNSEDLGALFSSSDYRERLANFCGLTEAGGALKKLSPDLIYSVSSPTLTIENSKLNIKMECTVTVPIYFCGVKISDAVAPVCISSSIKDIF